MVPWLLSPTFCLWAHPLLRSSLCGKARFKKRSFFPCCFWVHLPVSRNKHLFTNMQSVLHALAAPAAPVSTSSSTFYLCGNGPLVSLHRTVGVGSCSRPLARLWPHHSAPVNVSTWGYEGDHPTFIGVTDILLHLAHILKASPFTVEFLPLQGWVLFHHMGG